MPVETVRIEGLQGVLATLRALPPEIVSKGGGPVRSALRKAAQVIQRQEQANLQAIIDAPNADGKFESTGLTKANIVLTRGRRNAFKGESYLVRVRNKPFPGASGKGSTTAANARRLEYGTEKRAPMPFIRTAFEAKKGEALQVFTTEINKRLVAIVKKLERQNRVRT